MQGTMSGARRRGRPRTAWMDIKTWTGRTLRGRVNQNDGGHRKVEKVRRWCGRASDRGRLENRTEPRITVWTLSAVQLRRGQQVAGTQQQTGCTPPLLTDRQDRRTDGQTDNIPLHRRSPLEANWVDKLMSCHACETKVCRKL